MGTDEGIVRLGKINVSRTDAEIRVLVDRMRAGDIDARNQLVESVLPLLKTLCSRWRRTDITCDDLFQESACRLLKNIRHFDPDKGKLTTFLTRNVVWAARYVRQINERPPNHLSIDGVQVRRNRRSDYEVRYVGIVHLPEEYDLDDQIDGEMLKEKLQADHDRLSERQRTVVDLRLQGWQFNEIGERIGITKEGVRQNYDKVIARWRQQCGAE